MAHLSLAEEMMINWVTCVSSSICRRNRTGKDKEMGAEPVVRIEPTALSGKHIGVHLVVAVGLD